LIRCFNSSLRRLRRWRNSFSLILPLLEPMYSLSAIAVNSVDLPRNVSA
jgi:hypothetical protein